MDCLMYINTVSFKKGLGGVGGKGGEGSCFFLLFFCFIKI